VQHTNLARIERNSNKLRAALLVHTAIIGPLLNRRTKETGGIRNMATREIIVQRFSLISSKPFRELVAAIDAQIGHPDMQVFQQAIHAAKNAADLDAVVQRAVGHAGFMEFARFDLGEILRKEQGTKARPVQHMVIGNPLIMKEMVKLTPDAGTYAPITILIDEREDGVHLSYDRMASFLAPYGSQESLNVAQDLDAKVESLMKAAAG
jgi:uncharacterized protein (DUF302 family)